MVDGQDSGHEAHELGEKEEHRNPVISIAVTYLRLINACVPRSEVRYSLSRSSEYPFLGLSSLKKAFEDWGLSVVALKAEPAALDDIPIPAIVVMNESLRRGRDLAKVFAILTDFNRDKLSLFHPVFGQQTKTREEFIRCWTGYTFIAEASGKEKRRFARQLREEQKKDEAYIRSIRLIPRFLSPAECAEVIRLAESENLFVASGVDLPHVKQADTHWISDTRTSSSAFLPQGKHPLLDSILQRVSAYWSAPASAVEALQCVRYKPGEEFKPHFDASSEVLRTKTMLIYLNENFEGGETNFPEINTMIKPETGLALAFTNLNEQSRLISQSLHAGLPVREGVKYACNVWLRGKPLVTRKTTR